MLPQDLDMDMSESQGCLQLRDHFAELTDPRRGKVTHPLLNIITIAVCAVICGADDFVAIAEFGRLKREWLAKFLDLTNGIPSHDRFNQVLAAVRPDEFEKCLLSWIAALHEITDGQIIAIDGKTLRRSYDRASGKSAIHMVSAWASANHISLGQVVVDEKSNEITAIPKLLQMLEIKGSLVTIDAMGCQVKIAETIVNKQANYVLAVKGNQPTLHDGVVSHFAVHLSDGNVFKGRGFHRTNEKAHGRETEREYFVCSVPDDLPDASRWPKLRAIGMTVNRTLRDGKETIEGRYYILSRKLTGKQFAKAVRDHWSIENSLHWQLDVTFGEDQCRIRKGHADANFSLLRRQALSLLKNEQTSKVGIKNKRLSAALNEDYLLKVLFAA
jgi:predicted transposase YbfD/YdcC